MLEKGLIQPGMVADVLTRYQKALGDNAKTDQSPHDSSSCWTREKDTVSLFLHITGSIIRGLVLGKQDLLKLKENDKWPRIYTRE